MPVRSVSPTHTPRPRQAGPERFAKVRVSAAVAFVALLALAAGPASAQVSNLDDARFIRGLRERGLNDLLLYFLEKNPPKDPIVRLEMEVETAKMVAEDPNADPVKRRDAFDKVRDTYKKLLQQADITHPKRPIWAIDMALYDFETLLRARHVHAADFMEFGVPNPEMRAIFNEVIPEDARIMEDAVLDMFNALGDLPRDKDFETKFVNTGLWRELNETYNDLLLPYYRAMALRYAALMDPKIHKEIGDLAGKPFPGLLEEADAALDKLSKANLDPGTKAKIISLHGRIKIARKQHAAAIPLLDRAMSLPTKEGGPPAIAPFEKLLALLAKSQAHEGLKKNDEAMKVIEEARKLVKDPKGGVHGLINLILVYSRERALTGDDNVWTALLNDSMVTADPQTKAAVQDFVNKMIIGDKVDPTQIADDATPQKVMAAVDSLVQQAAPHLAEANAAKNQDEKNAALKAAGGFLDPAAELLKKLVAREKIEPAARAQALFKLGVVEYQRGFRFEAASAWAELAGKHSDQPEAEGAAKNAVTVAKDLWDNLPAAKNDPKFAKLLEDALVALVTKFPHTDEAKLHTYTLGGFYRETGDYAKAIEAYKQVPEAHPYHADALYEMGVCQHELMLRAEADADRAAKATETKIAMAKAQDALKATLAKPGGDAARAKSLRYKLGDSLLRAAEAMVQLNQNGEAQVALRDFDKTFAEFPDLIKAARIAGISVMLNLNQAAQAVEEVKKLVQQFPAEGGPLINRVLDLLNKRIDELLVLNREQEAMKLAADAVDMAKSLLEWAKTQAELKDNLVPFELIVARQLVIARQYADAEAIFSRLGSTPEGQNNQDILFGQAEALYMITRSGKLEAADLEAKEVQALKGLDKIIKLTAEPQHESPTWWRAWMIRLSIMDQRLDRARAAGDDAKVKDVAGDIYRAVARLELLDKELGFKFDRRIRDTMAKLKTKSWLLISQ